METGNKYFNTLTNNSTYDENTVLRLSAKVKADSFFYAVFDNTTHQLLMVDTIALSDLQNLSENHILRSSFNHVIIAIDNGIATLIRKDEFNEEESSIYFKHLSFSTHDGLYHFDSISEMDDIINLYPLNTLGLDKVLHVFPDAKIVHFSTCVINYAISTIQEGVFVLIDDHHIYIAVVSESHLLIYNNYKVKEAEDILYYISLMYQEFNLDRASFKLYLSGDINNDSKAFLKLKTYFKYIVFPELKDISISHIKEHIMSTQYFDQYIINQCE